MTTKIRIVKGDKKYIDDAISLTEGIKLIKKDNQWWYIVEYESPDDLFRLGKHFEQYKTIDGLKNLRS